MVRWLFVGGFMDVDSIRSKYDCDYDLGIIYRINTGGARVVAGSVNSSGYTKILIGGKLMYAHRFIWAHYYLEIPPRIIDHIDGNPLNNSIANLRAATGRLNQLNRRVSRNNTTGYTGVSYMCRLGKYKAVIYKNSKPIYLGLFDTAEDASEAYRKEKEKQINNELEIIDEMV